MWKPETMNGYQFMVSREGGEVSIDIDGSPDGDDGSPDGDQQSVIQQNPNEAFDQTQHTSHPIMRQQQQSPHLALPSQHPHLAKQRHPLHPAIPPPPAIQSQTLRLALHRQPHPSMQSTSRLPMQIPPRLPTQGQPRLSMLNQPRPPMLNQPRPPMPSQPPATQGQLRPPMTQGQPRPPMPSQPRPPATQGQPRPPVTQGQPRPPVTQGQPRPPMPSQPPATQSQPRLPMQGQPRLPTQRQPHLSMPNQPRPPMPSQPPMLSRYKGGIPGFTQFITVGSASFKFSDIIYNSGKNLLEDIITSSAAGDEVNPYCTADHLARLNYMYPGTGIYDPETMSTRIRSYMTWAKNRVQNSMRTGQGMPDDEVYHQDVSQEQIIVDLLQDARRSTTPSTSSSRVTNSSSSKSYVNPELLEALEEKVHCFLCKSTDDELQSTEIGEVCKTCISQQGDWITPAGEDTTELQEDARIQQNQILMMMDQKRGQSGCTGKTKEEMNSAGSSKKAGEEEEKPRKRSRRNRRYNSFSSDDDESDLGKLLKPILEKSAKKEDLEILKLELEIQNLKKNT